MAELTKFGDKKLRTSAKESIPNINHTQPRCALPSPPGSDGMVAANLRYLQRARNNAFSMGRKFVAGDLDL